jgi:hypothetical protein
MTDPLLGYYFYFCNQEQIHFFRNSYGINVYSDILL